MVTVLVYIKKTSRASVHPVTHACVANIEEKPENQIKHSTNTLSPYTGSR